MDSLQADRHPIGRQQMTHGVESVLNELHGLQPIVLQGSSPKSVRVQLCGILGLLGKLLWDHNTGALYYSLGAQI